MASLKECARDLVHRRDISIATYAVDEHTIMAEGALVDDRTNEYHLLSGEARPAGIIHHMVIRVLAEGPALIIREIEVEMPGAPRAECAETRDCLAGARGMAIGPGFTKQVKALAGGPRGCAHLVTLLLAIAPAIIQGYWAHRARRRVTADTAAPRKKMDGMLRNTCHVWREDGPTYAKLMRHLDGETSSPQPPSPAGEGGALKR